MRIDKSQATEKELGSAQIAALFEVVGSPKTYGDDRAACFDPHHSIHFFQGHKRVGVIDICFECNVLEATPTITVQDSHNFLRPPHEPGEDPVCIPRRGFTRQAWRDLKKLCLDWGVGHCPTGKDYWVYELDDDE